VAIGGGTSKQYTLTSADVNQRIRVQVTATNSSGSGTATSRPTNTVQATGQAPKNTSAPTISGTQKEGSALTVSNGGWTGTNPIKFTYQWQRCDSDGSNCLAVSAATGQTYGARLSDIGFRLRIAVTGKNTSGSATSNSGVTSVVEPAAPITNKRPTIAIVSIRFLGARVYARFRICDDSAKNLTILETDSRPSRAGFARRFSTLNAPNPCAVYTRNWLPLQRFRGHGRYTITLRARDTSGLTSASARRTFSR
jgi:hypothetical protein